VRNGVALETLYLALGGAVGAVAGLALGLVLGRGRGYEAALRRADAVGVLYDLFTRTWRLVPLANIAQNVFKLPDGTTLTVPEGVLAAQLEPLGKPAYVGFTVARVGSKAVAPENLLSVGLAEVALADEAGRAAGDVSDFLLKLVSKEAEERGVVTFSPDMKLALTVSVPNVFTNVANELLSFVDAVMQNVTMVTRMTRELERLYLERERLAAQRRASWMWWLLVLLVVGGTLIIMLTAGHR
jgi:hypothetical protein